MNTRSLPQDHRLVSIDPRPDRQTLSISLIVRDDPAVPEDAAPVRLRTTSDAQVFLGALVDRRGQIHDFIEIWVQTLDRFSDQYPAGQIHHTNPELDAAWETRFQGFAEIEGSDTIAILSESEPVPPLFFDATFSKSLSGSEYEGWRLCMDDDLLGEHDLPAYSASLVRFLCRSVESRPVREASDQDQLERTEPESDEPEPIETAWEFIRVAGHPRDTDTEIGSVPDLEAVFPDAAVFNPEGGRMGLRRHPDVSFSEYLKLVDGRGRRGSGAFASGLLTHDAGPDETEGRETLPANSGFLLPHLGRTGRLAEVLYLNLSLIRDLVSSVRNHTRHFNLPFLNLKPEHLGVSLYPTSENLPFLWTRRLRLLKPGSALSIPIPGADGEHYFVPEIDQEASIYWPGEQSMVVSGVGTVRIRDITSQAPDDSPDAPQIFTIEGTLETEEDIRPAKRDLAHLRLAMGGKTLEVFAKSIEPTGSPSKYRFRSFEQRHPDFAAILSESESNRRQFPRTQFTLIPVLGPPSDLFSCGVIALQTFFATGRNPLSATLDEADSLARRMGEFSQTSTRRSPGEQLFEFIKTNDSDHWRAWFGPHHLTRDGEDPQAAFETIPEELWWDIFALFLRFSPGVQNWSFCHDLSDFHSLAPGSVFDEPLRELDLLCAQARGLAVGNWVANREIAGTISAAMEKFS